MRVHELAKQLGMTNAEMMALCEKMGVGVKSHSSTLIEAQGDRLRRRAEKDGLTRAEQPEEPKPVKAAKKTGAKAPAKAATPKATTAKATTAKTTTAKATVAKATVAKATAKAAAPKAAVAKQPAGATPQGPTAAESAVTAVAKTSVPAAAAPKAEQSVVAPAASNPAAPAPSMTRITSSRPPAGEPPRPAARPGADVPSHTAAAAPPRPAASPARPTAASGRAIPPPPPGGRALSASGKTIPPPPGGLRPGGQRPTTGAPSGTGPRTGSGYAARPASTGGPGARPAGPGGARPGGYGPRTGGPGGARPGGFGGPRPGPGGTGGPGGARPGGPGGPGGARPGGGPGGPGGRPNGQRRAPRKKSRARRRRDFDEMQPNYNSSYTATNAPVPEGTIIVERGVSAQEFAPKLNRTAADVVRFLLQNGEMVTATMTLSDEQMELFALEVGADLLLVEPGQQEELELQALFDDSDDDDESLQVPRAPVITIMGHVDHGKTTLLDKIRDANVVAGEAGGITQHIGAYMVDVGGSKITFLDTPGHAAFTKMRARGAQVTDIVVLMVAADDGVMPQTIEAINHARAADVPIVVALNKIDKENADVQRVLSQLSEQELVPEAWGGDTIVVEMSAAQGLGVDDLLAQLAAVAAVEELTANPAGRAKGVVLEANLDTGRGPVATILVDKGELKVGDAIVAGGAWGRVRAMINDKGEQVKSAGPSTPVQVLGLQSVPHAGDEFRSSLTEKTARTVAEAREQRYRLKAQRGDARVHTGVKLEDIFNQIQAGEVATLNIVLKADVQGSLEAVSEALRRLERDEVKLAFVHRAVGGINENDISLAATTNATLIGFNVRPDRKARELASAEGVEIRTYEIIYKLLEDIGRAMIGMLAPEFEEVVTGEAEVREIFRVPKLGAIAGCYVLTGQITRGSKVRFLRDGTIIWKGAIQSLKRFKDDAREVREGFECGIGLSDFQDLKAGDLIETFEEREIARV
ncbi:MAG: translation initiation factor IF-2 [Actinobacteria bacterium]|nr:translation initiation factor IF-2 [Actinomycetota bacterium]